LLVAHIQLEWATIDGEVVALLLNGVKSTAGEVWLFVIVEATGLGPIECEMGKGNGNERESEDSVGKHVGV
jgi:hypothetical protein